MTGQKGKIVLIEGSQEFRDIKEEWQEKAKTVTVETLPDFLKELTETYQHDYGTICYATVIAAIAAANVVNHSPAGRITGFQAGAVMWGFIREWNYSSNKTGLLLLNYDNFLYPQYAENFQKVIPKQIWKNIQKEAQVQIEKADREYMQYLKDLKQYEIDIAAFITKHPDYESHREHYNRLGIGTGEQWEAEEKKKASGFEFAPQKPYEPINSSNPVYKHWESILLGNIPFGYVIKNEG